MHQYFNRFYTKSTALYVQIKSRLKSVNKIEIHFSLDRRLNSITYTGNF